MKIPPRPVIRWPGRKPRSAPIPFVRDPFVNTPLLRLSPGMNGRERFWISSFNGAFGSLGVVVDEWGECRLHPAGSFRHPGFYSAVQTGPEELWLCGNLATMTRLDLKRGRYEYFETGAPSALTFAGMAYDAATGKLCAIAFPPPRTMAIVFDIRRRQTVRIAELSTLDHYQRTHFYNGDGSWTFELQCPGLSFVRWTPWEDSFVIHSICPSLDLHGEGGLYCRLLQDERHRVFLPRLGWWNPRESRLEEGPRPSRDDATWFARRGGEAIGVTLGTSVFRRWNLTTGEEQTLGSWPGLSYHNVAVSETGRLIGVSKDGEFYRIERASGALECTRRLPTDSVQPADCVIRIDRDRILGTPFITQRFWETNLRTRRGVDCGAAAPGGGEILKVWNLRGRVYLAAYTGGELMEYDPAKTPRFPENPRVVAAHPAAMRPVAAADDGRRIWYACSHHYGHLGSILIRYDTRTGEARYRDNPLPDQQIRSLCFDRKRNALWCGTTIHADCQSVPPTADLSQMALLDADTLEPRGVWEGAEGTWETQIAGPLGGDCWLGVCRISGEGASLRWFILEGKAPRPPLREDLQEVLEWNGQIQFAGRPGRFVLRIGDRIELWNMRKPARLRVLADSPHLGNFFVQGKDLLCWSAWDVFVLENVLA